MKTSTTTLLKIAALFLITVLGIMGVLSLNKNSSKTVTSAKEHESKAKEITPTEAKVEANKDSIASAGAASENSKDEENKYGNWFIKCANIEVPDEKAGTTDKTDKKPATKLQKVCYLSQPYINKEKQLVYEFQFHYNKESRLFKLVSCLPANAMNLNKGSAIIVDQKIVQNIDFIFCEQQVCFAAGEIPNDNLNKITKAKEIVLATILYKTNQQLNFPLNNEGLKEGLEALKEINNN